MTKADGYLATNMIGENVYNGTGDNAENIGDVNDIVIGNEGAVKAVVIGVGGFLGIGEKSVAIDMSAFQPVPADTGSSTSSAVSSSNDPTNVKLKVSWTKDQLKNAPDFQYYKPASRTSDRPASSPTTGMAPRPATPGAGR